MLDLLLGLARALPRGPAVGFARFIVLAYLGLRPEYRAEIRANLKLVCGRDRAWFWLRNGWRIGGNLAAMALLGTRRGAEIIDKAIICGENSTRLALERDLHTIMASFHFGAWEFLPQVFRRRGYQVAIGVGRQRDSRFERRLARLRDRDGVRVAHRLADLLSGVKRPGLTGFMLDNTSAGQRCSTGLAGLRLEMPSLPFRLAARSGCGVRPVFSYLHRGRLRVLVHGPGDELAAARALLEQVRARPEEWVFWGKNGALGLARRPEVRVHSSELGIRSEARPLGSWNL